MKILSFDRKEGRLKVRIESEDDLWHLSNILDSASRVKMRDQRKLKKEFGERTEVSKVNVTLAISVEKVEFHEYLNTLRVGGKITMSSKEEIPLGSYHTFAIKPGDMTTIFKKFSKLDMKRIDESKVHQPKLLIVLMDRDNALFAQIKPFGISYPVEIYSNIPPKRDVKAYDTAFKKYFADVASALVNFKTDALIIAGPGNAKENFADYLRSKNPKLKFKVENASSSTRASIKDLVGRAADKLIRQTSLAKDTSMVDELFQKIAKGNLATYGAEGVKKAVKYGAVEKLLISADLVRKKKRDGTYLDLEKLLKAAEKGRAFIHIVGTGHEPGDKLEGLGGIAAILRFKIE